MLVIVYCNFFKEVRLGGWGTEGPKAPTLGQYVSACTTFLLGSGSICLFFDVGLSLKGITLIYVGGDICPPYHISAIFSGSTYPRRLQLYSKFKFCNYLTPKIGLVPEKLS